MALDTDAATQFADDSDDEEDGKAASKKKGAKAAKKDAGSDVVEYKGTLKFKGGKGASSNLYYVDYSTAINGDGLDREEKNELAAKVAAAEAEKSALERSLQQMTAETAQLLSEPTNEELAQRLDTGETELVEIQNQVRLHFSGSVDSIFTSVLTQKTINSSNLLRSKKLASTWSTRTTSRR
jgi:hypothetical protein